MKTFGIRQLIHWFILMAMLVLHVLVAYFTQRECAVLVVTQITILNVLWFLSGFDLQISAKRIIAFGILYRAVYLLGIPELSEDVYRYLWDGNLVLNGISPFAMTPTQVLELYPNLVDQGNYQLLNSKDYYSVYPPFQQLIYATVMFCSGGFFSVGIVVLRIFQLLTELGSMLLILKLLRHYKMPESGLILYAFCPLIIIEFIGNMHSEVIMVFPLLLSIWLLETKKTVFAAIAFGAAVLTKLLPLMLLPAMLFKMGWRRFFLFGSVVVFTTILAFIPFADAQLISNISDSLGKYFSNFEFNASIYYIVRWVGIMRDGYNPIWVVGPKLPLIAGLLILVISWVKRRDPQSLLGTFMLIWMTYYLFSTTVNPWYVAVLIPLSVFTRSRVGIVWAVTVSLSYLSYSANGVTESTWILMAEYLPVYLMIGYELGAFRWVERKWAMQKAEVKWQRLSQFYSEGEKVLDVGSGNGAFVKLLNSRRIIVQPTDVVSSSLFDDVEPAILDEAGISKYDPGCFETVQMITMLHHTEDPDKLLGHASKVAPKLIVMEDVFSGPWQEFVTHMVDSLVNLQFIGHPHTNRTDQGWKDAFEKAGYELKSTTSQRFLLFFRQNVYVLHRAA